MRPAKGPIVGGGVHLTHHIPGQNDGLPDRPEPDLGLLGRVIDIAVGLVGAAVWIGIPLFIAVWLILAVVAVVTGNI